MAEIEYDDNISTARFIFQSTIINDIFLDKKPLVAQTGEFLYISTVNSLEILKVKLTDLNSDRKVKYDSLTIQFPISSFLTTSSDLFYISDNKIFDITNSQKANFDELFNFDQPIQLNDQLYIALVSQNNTYSLLKPDFTLIEIPLPASKLDSIKLTRQENSLLIITKSALKIQIHKLLKINSLQLIFEIDLLTEFELIGIIKNSLFVNHFDKILKIDLTTKDTTTTFDADPDAEIDSVDVIPQFPQNNSDQYIVISNCDMHVLDEELKPAKLVLDQEFLPATTIGMTELKKQCTNLDPSTFVFLKNTAHGMYPPVLKQSEMMQKKVDIKGKAANQVLDQTGIEGFNNNDYYYIMVTSGYENNAANIHLFSVNSIFRNFTSKYQYSWKSHQSRASENVLFSIEEEKIEPVEDIQEKIQQQGAQPEQNVIAYTSGFNQETNQEVKQPVSELKQFENSYNVFTQICNQIITQDSQFVLRSTTTYQYDQNLNIIIKDSDLKQHKDIIISLYQEQLSFLPTQFYKLYNEKNREIAKITDVKRNNVKIFENIENIDNFDDLVLINEYESVEQNFIQNKMNLDEVDLLQFQALIKK